MDIYTTDKLSDADLVAKVLGIKSDEEACAKLATAITADGFISGSSLATVAREVKAVGTQRLGRLEAAIELGRRALIAKAASKTDTISTPQDVFDLMQPVFLGLQREHFHAILLNTKNRLIRVAEISVGSLNASIVAPRELFREAVSVSAASIVVCHNHPSGDPTPSGADIQLTRRLVKAGDVLGVEVLDHVVCGSESFASLREQGLM